MILFGASGHAKVIIDILEGNGVQVEKIYDDNPRTDNIFGIGVEHSSQIGENKAAIISVGNNTNRKKISEKYKFQYQIAVHKTAAISVHSKIGEGTVGMANVAVNPSVEIGKHCIINTGAVLEHDCKISDFAHISPNAALAGNVEVGEGTHVGIGASVIQGIKIGKWATIGAGAVVIKDVPDFAVVVGSPARIIKYNN